MKWISIEERLPCVRGEYLVAIQTIMYFDGKHFIYPQDRIRDQLFWVDMRLVKGATPEEFFHALAKEGKENV